MKDNKTSDGFLVIAGYGVRFYLHLHRRNMHTSPFSMAFSLEPDAKIIRQIDGQQLMSDAHMDEQFF